MESTGWVLLLAFGILITFVLLFVVFWFTYKFSDRAQGVSPYTGLPLRRATSLSFYSAEKVLHYLYDYQQFDNRIFKLSRAAFCRETGRIFTSCISWLDTVHVDWNFLQKRHPGNYVSWVSLNPDQKKAIRDSHDSLDGFQTDESSPTPSPRAVEPEYAYTKPGPLYVDLYTRVLMGWKVVPDTELEVLIVQKPIR